VRAVPELAAAPFEPAGKVRSRGLLDRAAEKCLGGLARASCDDLGARRYELGVVVVR
jgi:hypothetical protein